MEPNWLPCVASYFRHHIPASRLALRRSWRKAGGVKPPRVRRGGRPASPKLPPESKPAACGSRGRGRTAGTRESAETDPGRSRTACRLPSRQSPGRDIRGHSRLAPSGWVLALRWYSARKITRPIRTHHCLPKLQVTQRPRNLWRSNTRPSLIALCGQQCGEFVGAQRLSRSAV